MTSRSYRFAFSPLAVAALLALAAPRVTGAQGATACGGGGCEQTPREQRERMERTRKALEVAVDRARQRIEELRSSADYRDSDEERALRQARLELERAEPGTPAFAMGIARLQELAARHQARIFEDPQLKSALKDVTRLHTELAFRRVPRVRRGWLGVSFPSERRIDSNGRVTFTVDEYPEIVSVEPESPAEQGGIRRGDVLLALNGRDVVRHGPIPLSELLVPGETVRMKVRRDGRTREVKVRVAEQPTTAFVRVVPGAVAVAPLPPTPPTPPVPPEPVQRGTITSRRLPRPARAPDAPDVRQLPGDAQRVYIFNSEQGEYSTAAIFGAVLTRLDDDMRESLGTDQGVLVLRVLGTSAAARAGLRGGDVVLRVDDRRVRVPEDVLRAIRARSEEGESSAVLTVAKGQRERKVTLRW